MRYRDASHVLLEMLDRIEQRAARAIALADLGELELPDGIGDTEPAVHAAREFIRVGGAGYALITARR